MRVLVTGSGGFIGRPVVAALESGGHQVIGFDVADDLRDDVCDRDRVRSAMASATTVVHLAAKVGLGVDLDDLDDYARTNDLGTAVVLRAAAQTGITRLVYASSMVVYGEGSYRCSVHGSVSPPPRRVAELDRGEFDPKCPACGDDLAPGLVPESAPLDPRNVYAATKVHGEHLATCWSRETAGTVAALRFHNVYGPGMPTDTPYAGVAAIFRSSLRAGQAPQVFEDGRQRRDFVHVHDVARAVAAAVAAELPTGVTALNIGSGHVCTIGEIAELMSASAAGPVPAVTGRYRLGDVRHITADCRAARDVLGWSPEIDLAAGLPGI